MKGAALVEIPARDVLLEPVSGSARWRGMTRSKLLLPALLFALSLLPAAAQDGASGDLAASRAVALEAVNADRAAQDLDALASDETLDAIAQAHAEDMLARDYFAHESPDGDTVGDRFRDAGGSASEVVAENLATCTGCPIPPGAERVRAFQEGLMQSPGHRENILQEGVVRFGYGIAGDPERDRIVAVQTFAGPGGEGEGAVLDPDALVAAALEAVDAVRAERGVDPLVADDALVAAARALAEDAGAADGAELPSLDLEAALPEDARGAFVGLAALSAACTGCGPRETAADVERFVTQWSENAAETLAEPDRDAFGFALVADGEGRKVAVLLLGQTR